MHRVPLFDFTLPSIFNLLTSLARCRIGLMMCLIHINESAIHVLIIARPSHLCVPFSEKLDSLLDRLDNRGMMHILEMPITVVVRHFTSYKYLLRLALIDISHSFSSHLGFTFLCFSPLESNGRQERHQTFTLSLYRGKSIS
jgi:hypothetical protein